MGGMHSLRWSKQPTPSFCPQPSPKEQDGIVDTGLLNVLTRTAPDGSSFKYKYIYVMAALRFFHPADVLSTINRHSHR